MCYIVLMKKKIQVKQSTGFLSMAWINISLFTGDNSEALASFFIHTLQPSTSIGIRTSESTGCKEPLLVPWNFSDILYFSYDVLAKIVQQYKCKTQSCLPISSLSRHSYLKLSAWPGSKLLTICAATKADARKLPNVHTKRQPNLTIWSLMIRSFSISCYKFSYPWF